jgi:hypothetical protein
LAEVALRGGDRRFGGATSPATLRQSSPNPVATFRYSLPILGSERRQQESPIGRRKEYQTKITPALSRFFVGKMHPYLMALYLLVWPLHLVISRTL